MNEEKIYIITHFFTDGKKYIEFVSNSIDTAFTMFNRKIHGLNNNNQGLELQEFVLDYNYNYELGKTILKFVKIDDKIEELYNNLEELYNNL